ncbi:hypothetical protein CYLTODRAFT_239451 [Cylindrobasidium torrendii FP15055 ss-10]|uniref:CST complex subunit STN1 n=1 Tax=Cylindrobasidium torrendii FP15055 ss-10 TaxID=1314674 RepID=A0A0D7BT67_9AGAR|nr:hypothetical protein CYLTODRAFT_239451 [Cylindrobasidium torrendii FP15055 ss-10]
MACPVASSSKPPLPYTNRELFSYTTRNYEKCWVKDVWEMQPYEQGQEFFMLGRVPCRVVEIVGLCVGAAEYEARWKILVDDGTEVIECIYRPGPETKSFPTVNKTKDQQQGFSSPVVKVGWPLRVRGRVQSYRENRELHVIFLDRVRYNDEPKHWKEVHMLHKTNYDLDEPFQMTSPPLVDDQMDIDKPVSRKPLSSLKPHSYASSVSSAKPTSYAKSISQAAESQAKPISHAAHTTISVPRTPSPSPTSIPASIPKSKELQAYPPKFRHPSRLDSRNVTANILARYTHECISHAWSTVTQSSTCAGGPGFTLNYIRRVPGLALLAQRVVKADAKRAYREAKAKDPNARRQRPTGVDLGKRMKRLFESTVRRLLKDGSVVLWDGPAYNGAPIEGPWRSAQSQSQSQTQTSDLTMNTTINTTASTTMGEDYEDVEVSDAEQDEECYAPTAGALVHVFKQELFKLPGLDWSNSKVVMTDKIYKALRRDYRWQNVNQEQVLDALKSMEDVYFVRGGWRMVI